MRTPLETVNAFNDAINRHSLDEAMALMSDEVLFENTNPAPDGTAYRGKSEVRSFWENFFRLHPTARFEAEEIFDAGNRVVVRWCYRKIKDGSPWHLRGVDLFKVIDGRITEKLSYVKG